MSIHHRDYIISKCIDRICNLDDCINYYILYTQATSQITLEFIENSYVIRFINWCFDECSEYIDLQSSKQH